MNVPSGLIIATIWVSLFQSSSFEKKESAVTLYSVTTGLLSAPRTGWPLSSNLYTASIQVLEFPPVGPYQIGVTIDLLVSGEFELYVCEDGYLTSF